MVFYSEACKLYNNNENFINFQDLNSHLTCFDLVARTQNIQSNYVNIMAQSAPDSVYVKYFGWFMNRCMESDCGDKDKCKKLMYNDIYEIVYGEKVFPPTMKDFKKYLTNAINVGNSQNRFRFDMNDFIQYCQHKVNFM